jgi:hypothetical protein
VKTMAEKLDNINVESLIVREYNLGGFRNTLTISRKVVGPASIIRDNMKDLDKIFCDIELKFGDTIALSRREIKKLSKEAYADDGKVSKKKEE